MLASLAWISAVAALCSLSSLLVLSCAVTQFLVLAMPRGKRSRVSARRATISVAVARLVHSSA